MLNEAEILDEVHAELEDAIAPEWAEAEAERWAEAVATADEVGADAIDIYRDMPDRFIPTTDGQFEWALRKRARTQKKVDELSELMQREVYVITQAFRRRIDAEQHTVDFFTDMIERGVLAMEPDDKGRRTVKTAAGTAYVRVSEHFEWPADEELVGWCRERPALENDGVRVTVKPDKTFIKAYIKDTGETPAGLVVESRETAVIKGA